MKEEKFVQADFNEAVFECEPENGFLGIFTKPEIRFPLGKPIPKQLANEWNAKNIYE